MNSSTALKTTAALLLLAASGCVLDQDPDLAGAEELELSESAQEVTTCSPSIAGAAITKQISRIDEPVVDIQIVTISAAPFRWQGVGFTGGPAGAGLSLQGSSCSLRSDGMYRCAHNMSVAAGNNCYATGSYILTVLSVADGGSCGYSLPRFQPIPFSITTENMCSHDFDGVVDGF